MAQTGNVLIDFSKWIALLAIGLVALGFILFFGAQGWGWFSHGRHIAKIKATMFRETKKLCKDTAHPIFAGVINGSQKTIKTVTLHFTAHLPDHSSDQAQTLDDIIKPEGGFGHCYRFDVQQAYKDIPGGR